MISITHISFGVLLTEFVLTSLGVEPNAKLLAASGIGALLPDIDTPKASIGRIFPLSSLIEHSFGHRQITHSWLFIAMMLALLSPLLFFKNYLIYTALNLGVISHIMIDMANTSGVPFFYPNPARFVFPENKQSRVEVGSKKEFVLLAALLFLVALTTPISFIGYKSLFYRLSQTPYGAVGEAQKYADSYKMSARIKGMWSHSQLPVEGEFNILAVKENGLIIQDTAGRAYFISYTPFTSILINKISIVRKEKIKKEVINQKYSYCLLEQIEIPKDSIVSGYIFYEGYENIKEIIFDFNEEEYRLIRADEHSLNKLILSYCPAGFLENLKNKGLFISHADLTITYFKEVK